MQNPAGHENAMGYLKHLREANGVVSSGESGIPNEAARTVRLPENAIRERRIHPRYKCSGSAELCKEGTTVRTWGTFTDVSLSGCYVELQATFPPETKMELVLELEEIRVRAKATVRVTYPFLGMGLAFTEVSEADQELLQKLVATAASFKSAGGLEANGGEIRTEERPVVINASSALEALVTYFEQNEGLSRQRFLTLVRASQLHSTTEGGDTKV